MRIITARDAIKNAIASWLDQYRHDAESAPLHWKRDKTFGQARAELRTLDAETCSESDFNRATGLDSTASYSSWCSNTCDECGEHRDEVVRIGQEPDYDARWQDLCDGCLRKALAMVTAP